MCLITCLFVLAGCGQKNTVAPISEGFSCTADIQVGEKNYTAKILASGGGVFSAELTKPKSVKGLKFLFDGEEITVSYLGLKYTPENLPIDTGFAVVLKDVLSSVNNAAEQAVYKDGSYVVEGSANGTDYSFYVTEAGYPVKLTAPSLDLMVIFSDVQVVS